MSKNKKTPLVSQRTLLIVLATAAMVALVGGLAAHGHPFAAMLVVAAVSVAANLHRLVE